MKFWVMLTQKKLYACINELSNQNIVLEDIVKLDFKTVNCALN